jgi:hypothetical protein
LPPTGSDDVPEEGILEGGIRRKEDMMVDIPAKAVHTAPVTDTLEDSQKRDMAKMVDLLADRAWKGDNCLAEGMALKVDSLLVIVVTKMAGKAHSDRREFPWMPSS